MKSRLAILILLLIFGAGATLSCGVNCKDPANAASAQCVVTNALVDCSGGSLSAALANYGPIVLATIQNAPRNADGTVMWSSILDQLVMESLQYGGCVVAEVFDGFEGGGSGSGAVSSSAATATTMAISPADAASGFALVKAKAFPGRQFKIHAGRTL